MSKVSSCFKLWSSGISYKGVPQGSALGHILFILFSYDLGQHVGMSVCNVYEHDAVIYYVAPAIDCV
jgi:hypothetical protein